MAEVWARDELREFVRDRTLYVRDRHAAGLPAPAFLAEAAHAVGARDSGETVAATHPDDRNTVVEAFLRAIDEPGVVVPMRTRVERDGRWRHSEGAWLNQEGNPDVGGLLCVETLLDGPPIPPPGRGDAGQHAEANWMLLELDDAGLIVHARGQTVATLGYTPEEMLRRPPTDFLHADSIGESVALWLELRSRVGASATSRRRWVRKDGEEIWLESSYLHEPRSDDSAKVLVVVWDIRERLAQETELERSRSEYRQLAEELRGLAAENEALADDFRLLADEVPSAVFRCDGTGAVQFHNVRWDELVPRTSAGTRLHEVVHPGDHPTLDAALAATGDGEGARHSVEVRGTTPSTAWRITLRSLHAGDDDQRGIVGSIEDVTTTVSLRRQARHDSLTGLLNRHALVDRLAEAHREDPSRTYVMFLDLDGFKAVNDEHGHEAGDTVLVELARRLRGVVRPGDDVARFGGDEFVVVCQGVSGPESAAALAHRVERALEEPIHFAGGRWEPSASIGTAFSQVGENATAVLRRADLLMFEAKRARSCNR